MTIPKSESGGLFDSSPTSEMLATGVIVFSVDATEAGEDRLLKAGLDATRKLEDFLTPGRSRSTYNLLPCVCVLVCEVSEVDHNPRPNAAPCCCAALRACTSAARKRASRRRGPIASASHGASAAAARKHTRLSPNLLISKSAWPCMPLSQFVMRCNE